ncbi:terpene synthase family protein [Actinophytocola gossypii]|uniref:Terpene synthase n=1 Tax=Actinophytocola gossypii TaxID=2812003 RepID=A0ABT2J2K6_9PSEU|nr:terpene synthase family protein [Actinophytocola gossypii]MCT2581906.1 hypothetical protein [Actinophytocola gossypii]
MHADVVPPPFFCPFPEAVHPDAEELERRAIEWIDDVRVHRTARERARLIGSNSAEFYARFAPTGPTEHVLTAVLWVYWGFAFDDAWCDDGPCSDDPSRFLPMAGQVQRTVESGAAPAEPYAAALHTIVTRMRDQVSGTVTRRFTDAHRHWLQNVAWQVGNRAAGRMPTLPEYLTMRLGSSGGPPTTALLEIANAIEVPPPEMDSPAVRAVTEMTQLVAALDNDLQSFHKEMTETHTDQNIITVLCHHDRLDPAAALDAAVSIRDRVLLRLLDLRERARTGASEELRTYLDGLGHAIRGNIDWAATVPRYLAGAPGTPATSVRDQPNDPNPAPLPFPAFSWWWDRSL